MTMGNISLAMLIVIIYLGNPLIQEYWKEILKPISGITGRLFDAKPALLCYLRGDVDNNDLELAGGAEIPSLSDLLKRIWRIIYIIIKHHFQKFYADSPASDFIEIWKLFKIYTNTNSQANSYRTSFYVIANIIMLDIYIECPRYISVIQGYCYSYEASNHWFFFCLSQFNFCGAYKCLSNPLPHHSSKSEG